MPGRVFPTKEDMAIHIRNLRRLGRWDADLRHAGADTRKRWPLLTALKNACADYEESGWDTWPGHARRLAELASMPPNEDLTSSPGCQQ